MINGTAVTLAVNGVDRTRGMLATIGARVGALGARVRLASAQLATGLAVVAGAGVAAVAGISRATIGAAKSFSVLSDRAAQAGVSASELNQLITGLGKQGAKNATLDTVADALSRMAANTGRAGVEGLKETLAEIAALGDEGDRVRALSRAFGRAFGPGLAALVRNGSAAARAELERILATGVRVSDDLVEYGDRLADAWSDASQNIKIGWQSMWLEASRSAGAAIGGTMDDFRRAGVEGQFELQVFGRRFGTFLGNIVKAFSNIRMFFGDIFDWLGQRLEAFFFRAFGWLRKLFANAVDFFQALGETIAAPFTEDTVSQVWQRYSDRIVENEAAYFEDIGIAAAKEAEASFDALRKTLAEDLGLTLTVDISDIAEMRDRALAGIGDGRGDAGARALSGIGGAIKSAAAVLGGSYQAFRISRMATLSQSGAFDDSAALRKTATATEQTARAAAEQTRLLREIRDAGAAPGTSIELATV